jgi:hypothetical protein
MPVDEEEEDKGEKCDAINQDSSTASASFCIDAAVDEEDEEADADESTAATS